MVVARVHEARVNGLGFNEFAQLCLVLICKPQCSRERHMHLLAIDDSVRVNISGRTKSAWFRCLPREWVVRVGEACLRTTRFPSHITIPRTYARAHARTHLDKQVASSRGVLNQRQTFILSLFAARPESASLSLARALVCVAFCACVRVCTQIKENTLRIISGMMMRSVGTCNRSL